MTADVIPLKCESVSSRGLKCELRSRHLGKHKHGALIWERGKDEEAKRDS